MLLLCICSLIFTSCNSKQGLREIKKTHISMDTLVTLTLVTDSEDLAETASRAAFKEIDRLHILWDFFTDSSEISKLNMHSGISPMKVSEDTMNLSKRR